MYRGQTSVSQYTAAFTHNPSYTIELKTGITIHIPGRGSAEVILAINGSKLPIFQSDFTEKDVIKQTKSL